MTRTEQLADIADALTDEQFNGLMSFARSLCQDPYYDTASLEALESLDRGLADVAAGRVIAADDAFREIDAKIAARAR
jgi:predicted transcriptional regulator